MSSMLQSLYNSLSGMLGFSRSLDTISNNVSNMNTPGFRGSDSFFENVMSDDGTRVTGTGLRLGEGQLEQTGNDTDVAIQGQGLFVLHDTQGTSYYTRAGQFTVNPDGFLVDTVSGYRVQGLDAGGSLADINLKSYASLPASATTSVTMTGNLSSQDTTVPVTGISVYDAAGTAHTFSLSMTSDATIQAGSWTVSILDEHGASVGSGEVRFDQTGAPEVGFSSVTATATLDGQPQNIVFDFGTPGGISGATELPGTPSSLTAHPADGHPEIGTSTRTFDTDGVMQITYTDGEKAQGPQLALAAFEDESSLQLQNGRLFAQPPNQTAMIGKPNLGRFGQIVGGSLEMSNVDLTQELADMIVIQRGYQASSHVMTISSDMLQQLYDSTRSG
jgi:flagellar hook protein FlgE